MKPCINVEFTARSGNREFKEESVTFASAAEFYNYVSPGGGCERIPDYVEEIQMLLLPHERDHSDSLLDDIPVTLELGMIFMTGRLTDIVQVSQQLLGKASRDELSHAFLQISGIHI